MKVTTETLSKYFKHLKPSTYERYAYVLDRFARWYNRTGDHSVDNYVNWLYSKGGRKKIRGKYVELPMKPNSVKLEIAIMKSFLSILDKNGVLGNEVLVKFSANLKIPAHTDTPVNYLSKGEIMIIRDAWKWADRRPLFEIFINTGMKRKEANALTWADIDLEKRQLTIRSDRTGMNRTIRISTILLQTLQMIASGNWPKLYPKFTKVGPVIRFHKYTHEWLCKPITKIIGRRIVVPDLRHTFAVRCLEEKIPVNTVSLLLGHKSVNHTMMYKDYIVEDDLNALDNI